MRFAQLAIADAHAFAPRKIRSKMADSAIRVRPRLCTLYDKVYSLGLTPCLTEYIEVALAIGVDPSKIIKKLLAEPATSAPRR